MTKRNSPKWKEEELIILYNTMMECGPNHIAHYGRIMETRINRSSMSVAAKLQNLRTYTSDIEERVDDEGHTVVWFRGWSELEDETLVAMHRRQYSMREMCLQLDRCVVAIDIRMGQMGLDPSVIDHEDVPFKYTQYGLPPQEKKREERRSNVKPVERLPPQIWKRRARRALAKVGDGCLYTDMDSRQIGYRFCGKPRAYHSPYCPDHHAICWNLQPPNVRELRKV